MESIHHLNTYLGEDGTALQQLDYRVLKAADIRQRQLHDITEVCSTLGLSRSTAMIMLRHCNWNVSKLFDELFDEEDEVRNKVGLFKNPHLLVQFLSEYIFVMVHLLVKFALKHLDGGDHRVSSNFCGHFYCRSSWGSYREFLEHERGKREFLEYLQGEAECGLEKLHRCAEVEPQEHIQADRSLEELIEFRAKLVQLKNLVRALENDLSEISSQVISLLPMSMTFLPRCVSCVLHRIYPDE